MRLVPRSNIAPLCYVKEVEQKGSKCNLKDLKSIRPTSRVFRYLHIITKFQAPFFKHGKNNKKMYILFLKRRYLEASTMMSSTELPRCILFTICCKDFSTLRTYFGTVSDTLSSGPAFLHLFAF